MKPELSHTNFKLLLNLSIWLLLKAGAFYIYAVVIFDGLYTYKSVTAFAVQLKQWGRVLWKKGKG